MTFSTDDKIEMIKKFDSLPEKDKSELYDKYGKENIDKLKELTKEMYDSDEIKLTVDQVKMPNDWLIQVSDAKVDHDKHGAVALIIVLPLSWRKDFIDKVKSKDAELLKFYDKKHNYFWGADLHFGPTDKPIASSDIWIRGI